MEKEKEGIGGFIKQEREKKGMTVGDLAEKAGVSASYINRIEKGARNTPSAKIVERIARALEIPLEVFFTAIAAQETPQSINKAKSINEILFFNDFTIREDRKSASALERKEFMDLIQFILDMNWEENRYEETLKLIDHIDKIKQAQKKKD